MFFKVFPFVISRNKQQLLLLKISTKRTKQLNISYKMKKYIKPIIWLSLIESIAKFMYSVCFVFEFLDNSFDKQMDPDEFNGEIHEKNSRGLINLFFCRNHFDGIHWRCFY